MSSPFVERFLALRSSGFALQAEGRAGGSEEEEKQLAAEALIEGALRGASALRGDRASLDGARVAMLASPSVGWVQAFFSIVLAGGVVVPLSPLYPPGDLAWFAENSRAELIVVSHDLRERARLAAEGRRLVALEELTSAGAPPRSPPHCSPSAGAMLLYTSGTTGKPKGAEITHANVAHQAALVGEAWALGEGDTLLHALPLHHLHGVGISLLNSLLAGATTRLLTKFEAPRVWEAFSAGTCNVWMAVPTMYKKLFEAFDAADEPTRRRWAEGARRLRLATSGSAALPVTLAERWRALTGAIPLERYGMTEFGVAASNPLDPAARRAGTVGPLLRTFEARIVDDSGGDAAEGPGELLVRGPSVFAGYFERAEATRAAFEGAWFKTGDVVTRSPDGYVRILGRTSIDILKSGGYKLSALEVEEALREHPAVAEVAVVGIPDATWGERVVAVIVPVAGREAECSTDRLRGWAKERLPAYKVPREVVLRTELPRNALGKVTKLEIIRGIVG